MKASQNMLRNLVKKVDQTTRNIEMSQFPLLAETDLIDYKCEGYALRAQSVIDNQIKNEDLEFDEIVDKDIEEIAREASYYSKHFLKKAHHNFVGKLDTNEQNVFTLSVRFDTDEQKYILLLRTKNGNQLKELNLSSIPNIGESNEDKILNIDILMQVFEKVPKDIKPVTYPMASRDILDFDKHLFKQAFTFGIIYQKYGQISQKEIFLNKDSSKEFEEFLEFIGQKVTLKDFKEFRGGLDVKNNSTGVESIYENYECTEIMFHVSTFLAHLEKSPHFVERKRLIGNDRVAIVFQDRETLFSPKMFSSTLLHVFMIVHPVIIDNETKRYKISVISKKDVPEHRPEIQVPYIFNKDEKLKRFMLSKLINAEYACLRAPAFVSANDEKIAETSLQKLSDTLTLNSSAFLTMPKTGSSASLSSTSSASRLNVLDRIRKLGFKS